MSEEPKTHWALTRRAVWIGLFVVGPLGLPLLWLSPRFSQTAKILISVLTLAATVLTFYYAGVLMQHLETQLKDLKEMGLY